MNITPFPLFSPPNLKFSRLTSSATHNKNPTINTPVHPTLWKVHFFPEKTCRQLPLSSSVISLAGIVLQKQKMKAWNQGLSKQKTMKVIETPTWFRERKKKTLRHNLRPFWTLAYKKGILILFPEAKDSGISSRESE